MPALIKNGASAVDTWTLLAQADNADVLDVIPGKNLLVPLQFWNDFQQEINQYNGAVSLWLDSHEQLSSIDAELNELPVIALNFPVFSDGRSFSKARELRQRHEYQGEIRAIGDVLRDQLFYMAQCGFDSFSVRHDQDLDSCLTALKDFSTNYQATAIEPRPLFRRR